MLTKLAFHLHTYTLAPTLDHHIQIEATYKTVTHRRLMLVKSSHRITVYISIVYQTKDIRWLYGLDIGLHVNLDIWYQIGVNVCDCVDWWHFHNTVCIDFHTPYSIFIIGNRIAMQNKQIARWQQDGTASGQLNNIHKEEPPRFYHIINVNAFANPKQWKCLPT